MSVLIEEFFTHMPDWFFVISALILLAAIGGSAWWIILGAKRFSDSLGKEQRLYELQENLHKLAFSNEYHKGVSLKLLTVIDNSRHFINSIKNGNHDKNVGLNVQRIVESLAADVKTNPGEKHRSGFWIVDRDKEVLTLLNGSSGFPDHYLGNRELGLNQSIAGRCFRKNELINCTDVTEDEDYESSNSDYRSLICVPVDNFGVLTVDGKEPFDKNVESIAELYATLIELALKEYALEVMEAEKESAVTNIEGEEDNND